MVMGNLSHYHVVMVVINYRITMQAAEEGDGLNPTVIGCRGRRRAEPHCYRLQRKEIGCYQVPCAGFPNPLCGSGKMDGSPSSAAYNSGVQPVSFLCSL